VLQVLNSLSLKGKRDENQDSILVKGFDNNDWLLVVADGMGGGAMGAKLSLKAVDILQTTITKPLEYPLIILKSLLFEINKELHAILESNNKKQKGGTTLVVAYYKASSKRVFYINIGDSRVWLFRDKRVVNLSIDQNRYQTKKLQNQEATKDDKRIVNAVLGKSSDIEIDNMLNNKAYRAIGEEKLQKGDLLFLSSDGFHDTLEGSLLEPLVGIYFNEVLQLVMNRSDDNISVIVAKEET